MIKRLLTFAVAFTAALSLYADRITLADGSVINGTVKSITDGTAVIATSFAGEIKVAQDQIVNFNTTTPVNVVMADGSRLNGAVAAAADNAFTLDQTKESKFIRDIKYIWSDGMADPTIPPGRAWSGEISVDISGKNGNNDKLNAGAGASATLAGPEDKLRLYVSGKYEREDGFTSTEEYIGGIDFESSIAGTRNSWYTRYEIEQEETSGLKLRHELGLGYGYYFIEDELTLLRGRVGFTGISKEYTTGDHDDALGMEAAIHFERKIGDWGKLVSDLTYQPTFEDLNNYRIVHESALDIPVLVSVPLNLRLGMKNEYNSQVAEGAERMETSYFAKIVYKWK